MAKPTMRNVGSRRLQELAADRPSPFALPANINIPQEAPVPVIENGIGKIENPDGSLTIDLNPKKPSQDRDKRDFYANIADDIEEAELDRIAADIITGIENDQQSRQEWLSTRARGITLLGLKLNEPKGESSGEGVSSVQHPLLLETTLRFQANARGELLPAAGPVKVRNDGTMPPPTLPAPPMPPPPPQIGHNGGPPMGAPAMAGQSPGPSAQGGAGMGPPLPPQGTPPHPPLPPAVGGQPLVGGGPGGGQPPVPPPPPTGLMAPPKPVNPDGQTSQADELANALETDMNFYLTSVATEYYPDTDRMLFWVGAGGQGIKKVYNCPIRRRPVSESVDAEDLVVANASTNLENCGRITHIIKMRPSILKRMQLLEEYRDVDIGDASQYQTKNVVEQKKDEIQGINPIPQKPSDADHIIYECYCELNIAGFEHKERGKETGLQLPYVVTIHKDSRKVLSVRRNWREEDPLCLAKEYFVDFPFVRAMGFYGIGLIHIVGNTTTALTAAWREMLDAGMFANFPGFVYQKQFGRQLTNLFRVPPGGGIPIDTNGLSIQQAVMPLPYKEPGPAFTAFVQHVEEVGQRVGGVAEIGVGEGKQDAPVGTTLALIEQSTKMMDAVHKRLCQSQSKEFQLLIERFREDPEAFWRFNKKTSLPWERAQFLAALDNHRFVPVADPNNPTSLHRIAKGTVIKQLQSAAPDLYDPIAVDTRVMRIAGIDPEGLFRKAPAPPPPDPRMMAVQAKMQANQVQQQVSLNEANVKQQTAVIQSQDKQADRESRERIEAMRLQIAQLKIVHDQMQQGDRSQLAKAQAVTDSLMKMYQVEYEMQSERERQASQHEAELYNRAADRQAEQDRHEAQIAADMHKHERQLEVDRESDQRRAATEIEKAKLKPNPKSGSSSGGD